MARSEPAALIVLDIHLPDRSGWDLLADLKADETTRDAPVLVVSVDDNRGRALALGACDHIVKPADRDQLAAAALRYARIVATPTGDAPRATDYDMIWDAEHTAAA
jgi:DNA-binding response OmpR family regulator